MPVTSVTPMRRVCANSKVLENPIERGKERAHDASASSAAREQDPVRRALRHQGLWLTLAYVSLILLMARAHA
jgi:hypothetical protein